MTRREPTGRGEPRKRPRRGRSWIALALVLTPVSAFAETAGGSCGADFDHGHGAWNGVLAQHVKGGQVSYGALKASGRQDLDRYLRALQGVCKARFDAWNENQRLAFWLNSYNAYTVAIVLDNHPTTSIMKIGGGQGAAFKQRFIPLGHLRGAESHGAKISLDEVENGIIRKQFREPRIHFALVCAAKSCPPLRSEAYTASALKSQLEAQTRAFLRDRRFNRYDASSHTLSLSRIFEWYAGDFENGGSTVASFVGRYLDDAAREAIEARPPRVTYLDYDWSLNGR